MSRRAKAVKDQGPTPPPVASGSVLPPRHTPRSAAYAHGPFITPETVTPTEWQWRGMRTYVVRAASGHDYRCIRVAADGRSVGYWAVELLGAQLDIDE